MSDKTYNFVINGLTPETLPMKRFAEYLEDLAALYGHTQQVHLAKIKSGSIQIEAQIDGPAQAEVSERLSAVNSGNAEPKAMDAFRKIDENLKKDNAVAYISNEKGANVIKFPGRERQDNLEYQVSVLAATLQGVLTSLTGRDETKHAQLMDGDITHAKIETKNLELIKSMREYLWGDPIRLKGRGFYKRDSDGIWSLEKFDIEGFEPLENISVQETVAKLRNVPNGIRVDAALLREFHAERGED